MDLEFVNCQLCGADSAKKLLSIDKFCYVKCRNCGLVYLNPRPSPDLLNDIYQGDKKYSTVSIPKQKLFPSRSGKRA